MRSWLMWKYYPSISYYLLLFVVDPLIICKKGLKLSHFQRHIIQFEIKILIFTFNGKLISQKWIVRA